MQRFRELPPPKPREKLPLRSIERRLIEAVRRTEGCEGFGGLVVQLVENPKAGEANWEFGFVHYGTAHEAACKEALARAFAELKIAYDATD